MNKLLSMSLIRFRLFIFTIGLIFFTSSLLAQNDSIKYDITLSGLTSTGNYSPFWLQSNQYGKISSSPSSANLLVGVYKDFETKKRLFQYGFKANTLIQTDKTKSTAYFHELYVKARLAVFDIVIGSREEQFGVQD